MTQAVPVIDISPWFGGDVAARELVARRVDDACREWGFLVIAGHGMDAELMRSVQETTREFFDLPVEEKEKASSSKGLGYTALRSKSLSRSYGNPDALPDLRESFSFRTGIRRKTTSPAVVEDSDYFASNPWPERPAAMKEVWRRYHAACDALTIQLMHICATALGLREDWFDDKVDLPMSSLVAQHYPELKVPPKPGEVRGGAHTDFGTLTLLLTEDKPGGLQVMGTSGQWFDVRPVPGAYIVNLGDMMAQWTNDRWRSTLHRVVNPPLDAGRASRRLSIVYFNSPNYDAVIECIPTCIDAAHPVKYEPVIAGEHLLRKVQQVTSPTVRAS